MKHRLTHNRHRWLWLPILAAILVLASLFWSERSISPSFENSSTPTRTLSTPLTETTSSATLTSPSPTLSPTTRPVAALIDNVPFIEQAPHKNWDEIHEETCEEASVLAVYHFLAGDKAVSADQQEQELQNLIVWEQHIFGQYEDTTADQTARLLSEYYKFGDRVRVIDNASLADLETLIARGQPVIVPAAGRELGNRHFKTPGPIYHMTVVIGYDRDEIITNDPGTRHGRGYRYDKNRFWDAIHDFVDRTDAGMARGAKVLITVDPAPETT